MIESTKSNYFARFIALLSLLVLSCVLLSNCKDEKAKGREAAKSFLHSAEAFAAQGQYRSAIATAKNAIQKSPDDPEALKLLASFYNELGAYLSTQQLLEPQVQNFPQVIPELAFAYIENKKYRSANKILSNYQPEKNDLKGRIIKHKLLARAHIYLANEAEFMGEHSALLGLGASAEEAAQLKAENFFNQGRAIEAYTALDDFVDSKKMSVKSLVYFAMFFVSQEKYTEAEAFLQRALAQLPSTDLLTAEKSNVLRLLIDVLNKQGRTADAYVFQKALSDNNPESVTAQEKFNESMKLFNKGKLAESEKLLAEIREQFPQEKNAAILLGLVNFQQGDFKQANELFDHYLDLETTTGPVVRIAAMAKFRINQTDEALELLRRGVEEQPDNPDMLAAYGVALLDQDIKSSDAKKYLEKSLAANAKQPSVGIALAKHYLAVNDRAMALSKLQTAYAAVPTDFSLQLAYLNALVASGKLDQARVEISDFKKANPELTRNQYLDGWYKSNAKDYPGAQTVFERALTNKNNDERIETYKALVDVYVKQGQKIKAAERLKELLSNYPDQVAAYADWLQLESSLNRTKEAVNYLVSLEGRVQAWQPAVVLAQVYVSQNKYSDAIKHIEIALQRNPTNDSVRKIAANLYYQYGMVLLSNGQVVDAKSRILKSLEYAPDNMNYLASLVQIEINLDRTTEAQKVLDQFSQSPDVAAERAFLESTIRAKENKPEEALNLLKESWSKKPLPIVAEALYKSYEDSQQERASEIFVADWIKQMPKSIRPVLIKALSEQKKGNLKEAALLYEKGLVIEPNNLMALNNLAWIYSELNDEKALNVGEKAYQLDQNNPAVIDTYASILWKLNRLDEAYSLFQKASLLEPKNAEIQKHLQTAKRKLRK